MLRKTAFLEERVAEVACGVLAQVLHTACKADTTSYRQLLRKTCCSVVLVLAKHCPGVAVDTSAKGDGEEEEDEEDEVSASHAMCLVQAVRFTCLLSPRRTTRATGMTNLKPTKIS